VKTLLIALVGGLLLASAACAQQEQLTPRALQTALAARPSGADADKLAERIRGYFGPQNLARWPGPRVEDVEVAWAVEVPEPGGRVQVVADDGSFTLNLDRVGSTNVYAGAATLQDGRAFRWSYVVGAMRAGSGQRFGGGQLEVYLTHPDSKERTGVPKGAVRQMPPWKSGIFAGTTRDWWVYVPAQYRSESPACVMVFQDGAGPRNYVPIVFDNLIARGEMPVTVGIFINPGTRADGGSNRSFEYDTLSDQYARFLLEEILPEVEKTIKLRHDAPSRGIAGSSSGGICAWTVAWQRPTEFSKVLSWVGSFTNIAHGATMREGGHNYPALIRKTSPRKPIRMFMQDGVNDLDNANGNWPLANMAMAKALAYAGYDYKLVMGQGFHSGRHGQAILPDSLRWLWRDYAP